jgi:predicted Rossmann-fold nucleotide-binding protein
MRVIIAGSRDGCPNRMLAEAIEKSGFEITELVCGMARGVDTQALVWARGAGIPVREFHADWSRWGHFAGPKRNAQMAEYADALIALPGGAGTRNMIKVAEIADLKVYVA